MSGPSIRSPRTSHRGYRWLSSGEAATGRSRRRRRHIDPAPGRSSGRPNEDRHATLRVVGVELALVLVAVDVMPRDPEPERIVAVERVIARTVGDADEEWAVVTRDDRVEELLIGIARKELPLRLMHRGQHREPDRGEQRLVQRAVAAEVVQLEPEISILVVVNAKLVLGDLVATLPSDAKFFEYAGERRVPEIAGRGKEDRHITLRGQRIDKSLIIVGGPVVECHVCGSRTLHPDGGVACVAGWPVDTQGNHPVPRGRQLVEPALMLGAGDTVVGAKEAHTINGL